MFETRSRGARVLLQVVLTIAIVPFLIPIVSMFAKSLEGAGWGNYAAVFAVPGFFRFFLNSAIVAAGVDPHHLPRDDDGRLRILEAAHPQQRGVLLAAHGGPDPPPRSCSSRRSTRRPSRSDSSAPSGRSSSRSRRCRSRSPCSSRAATSTASPTRSSKPPASTAPARSACSGRCSCRSRGPSRSRSSYSCSSTRGTPISCRRCSSSTTTSAWSRCSPEFFRRQYNDDIPKVLAAAVVTAIPTIVAYVALQKQFERGMAAGAIK